MPVKTEEKKQHFDDIYFAETPVPYKTEIMDKLEYLSDNFNCQMFDRLILPWIQQQQQGNNKKTLNYVDLCSCFGNTTMSTVLGMSYDQIRQNWKDVDACQTIQGKRRFDCHTSAVDMSENAMNYSKRVGIFDDVVVCDLNDTSLVQEQQQVQNMLKNADIVVSAGALICLDLDTIDWIVKAFASDTTKEGYMLVNFLSLFSFNKANATKGKLLEYLDFVGSMAAYHRKLTPFEQEMYPGETWVLLELWVLKKRHM